MTASPRDITIHPAPSADVGALIQAAVNQFDPLIGGVVNLSAGDHTLATLVFITTSNVTIRGKGKVTLTAAPTLPVVGNCYMVWLQGAKHTTIEGISFDANVAGRGGFNGTPQTILINWSDDTTIDKCSFTGAPCDDIFAWGGDGCPNPPCVGLKITNSTFGVAQRNNISLVNVRRILIHGNTFAGKNLTDPASNVDAEANWNDPFGCLGDLTITNNTFTDVYRAVFAQNVNVSGPSGIWFQGNTVNGAVYGFENQWAMGDVSGNTFTNVTGAAVVTGSYAPGSVPVSIHDNTFKGCPNPIVQADVGHDLLANNVVG